MEKRLRKRKSILIGVGAIIAGILIYVLFIGYITSYGYRDYKEFCEQYIPHIDNYILQNKKYPEKLSIFPKPDYYPRYDVEECLYFVREDRYELIAPLGLIGAAYYDSKTKLWNYD